MKYSVIIFSQFLLIITLSYGCSGNISDYPDSNLHENGNLDSTFNAETDKVEKILTPEEAFELEKERLKKEGWEENDMENGQLSKCYNFKPKYSKIDNKLEVNVGGGTDVVIKLMNKETNKCIRYVFINSNSSYEIRNVPEGIYYLKIAYGKNWISKVENGKCIGKFLSNPTYEEGSDEMDFNIQRTFDGRSIPSFQLSLDVVSTNSFNTFSSQNISEESFNK
jgi:hypothetical protein